MVDFLLSRYAAIESDEGQGLAEYALILALIAIIAIGALFFLGGPDPDILVVNRRGDLAHRTARADRRPVPCRGRAVFLSWRPGRQAVASL